MSLNYNDINGNGVLMRIDVLEKNTVIDTTLIQYANGLTGKQTK